MQSCAFSLNGPFFLVNQLNHRQHLCRVDSALERETYERIAKPALISMGTKTDRATGTKPQRPTPVLPYCCRQPFQPAIPGSGKCKACSTNDTRGGPCTRRFELPSSAMSSNPQIRVKGCGKTGQNFTLYHVSIIDGTALPLAQGFRHLDCGCCVSTFQKMTYGIVLCLNCADHLGFPRPPKPA